MRYVPYGDLAATPNIIVDGYATDGTILVLSHWPGAGTPAGLEDDLSTQIVFRYLDRPDLHVDAGATSNNHFDEDGLCGIYALIEPGESMRRRERLIDVARYGDFGTWLDRDSARIAMAVAAYADEERSPLGGDLFASPYPAQAAALYAEMLERLPSIIDDVDASAPLWADEDARLQATLDALSSGDVTIEERPDIDLAIVRAATSAPPHDAAINNATERHRVLTLQEGNVSLRLRYETWVTFVSRPVVRRPDLAAIAARLSEADSVAWVAGDVDDLTPDVKGAGGTSLGLDVIERIVTSALS